MIEYLYFFILKIEYKTECYKHYIEQNYTCSLFSETAPEDYDVMIRFFETCTLHRPLGNPLVRSSNLANVLLLYQKMHVLHIWLLTHFGLLYAI